MKVSISKSSIHGKVITPSSKSYTIRGLMCAALASGQSELRFPLLSDDTLVSLKAINIMGINVKQTDKAWYVNGGTFKSPESEIFCNESAASLRFMTAIGSLIPGECTLSMAPSLARRPILPLINALNQLGINCNYQDGDTKLTVHCNKFKGGLVTLPGNISSQFISALLLIAPFATEEVNIKLTSTVESIPYIRMTKKCMEIFGIEIWHTMDFNEFRIAPQKYQPANFIVEGDWSSASNLLALAAAAGKIQIMNLNLGSLQADKQILNYLQKMNARITVDEDKLVVTKSELTALEADLSDCIDLLPTLAVLTSIAKGVSKFTGINRARLKESDRVSAVKEGLLAAGIKVMEQKDALIIVGGIPHGAVIDSKGDHRIAMAFSILGSICDGITITGAECVAKTFPGYWDTVSKIGLKVERYGK